METINLKMETINLIVSVTAFVVSVISALIARRSLKEQVKIAKLTAGYTYLASAESLLEKYEDLFELHNVNSELMRECDVKHTELLYLIESFSAGDLYHRIEGNKSVTLGYYRENLLCNEKVQKVWQKIIRHRFLSDSPFSKEIDKFIEQRSLV